MTAPSPGRRQNIPALILAVAVLGACALYWLHLAHGLPLWHDEAITLLDIAGNPSPDWPSGMYSAGEALEPFRGVGEIGDIAEDLKRTDVHPPIYYYAANLWAQALGNDIATMRALSVTVVICAMVVAFAAARRSSNLAGLVSLCVLAASPTLAAAAVNARNYSVGILEVCLLFAIAHRHIERTNPSRHRIFTDLCLMGLVAALGFMTNFMTVLVSGPAFAFMALRSMRKAPIETVAAGSLTAAASCLPALPFLAVQMTARPDQYAGFSGYVHEITAVFLAVTRQVVEIFHGQEGFSLIWLASGTIFLLSFFAGALRARSDDLVALHLVSILGAAGAAFALFHATDKTMVTTGFSRYLLFTVPSFALLAGRLADMAASGRRARVVLLLATVALASVLASRTPFQAPHSLQPFTEMIGRAMSGAPAERNLVIMIGNGRGTVGHMASAVRPETPFFIARTVRDLEEADLDLTSRHAVLLVHDESKPDQSGPAGYAKARIAEAGLDRYSTSIWMRPEN